MAAIVPTAHSAEAPLLEDTVDGTVDFKSRPANRFNTGRWRSAGFMIAVEVAERFAYYGLCSNLVTYLTGPLGQSMATAAVNLNVWDGTAMLLPIFGAFVADAYLGRYRTVIAASLIYISGLGLLTLSAIMLTSLHNSSTLSTIDIGIASSSPPRFLVFFLFMISLYLVALGQSGHKPCLQAFGADQFDVQNSKESVAKSSFFNWWYLGTSVGGIVSVLIIVYIQENISWSLAFGILFILMVAGLMVFLLGTKTYRYSTKGNGENPFARIGRVFVAAVRNRDCITPPVTDNEKEVHQSQLSSEQFKFLNKALLGPHCSEEARKKCSIQDVEDAKALLRLIPIWASCLVYGIVYEQVSIFFIKQGATMDRNVSPGVEIPSASLQCFVGISIIVFIPIYDRIVIPVARVLTHEPSGITTLQRIGTGLSLSIISMVIAALIEMKRLKTAQEYGLIDSPDATVPMSVWWLVPQYILFGLGDVLTIVGMQEFFYDQVPTELRSMGISFYLSVLGVGSFLSGILVSVIDELSSAYSGESWFSSNLNRAHLDYFYWFLAGLSVLGLVAFLRFSKSFVCNTGKGCSSH